jgi:D-serine deaminase-like pyridoxal phosphate-dependent protein
MKVQKILSVVVLAMLASVPSVQAKEKHYQSGKLLRMDSVSCGMDQKNGKSITGELIGTDSAHMKTKELLCQEYVLETPKVVYHIRPKDEKHPALLPIGEKAQFRIEKDMLKLRVEDADDKERDYIVVSMAPNTSSDRDDSSVASSR